MHEDTIEGRTEDELVEELSHGEMVEVLTEWYGSSNNASWFGLIGTQHGHLDEPPDWQPSDDLKEAAKSVFERISDVNPVGLEAEFRSHASTKSVKRAGVLSNHGD